MTPPQRRTVRERVAAARARARCPECRCRRRARSRHAAVPAAARWPGLRRKNVMLSLALTAAPITAPLAPLMPLGRSTAMIGAPLAFIASISARASPSTARLSPAPNSASTMTPAPAICSGCRRLDRTAPSPRSFGCVALQRRDVAEQHQPHRIAALGEHARRHEPVAAIVARAGHDQRRACRADGARPHRRPPGRPSPSARCRATPPAIASRSHSAISSGVRSSIIAFASPGRIAQSGAAKTPGNQVLAVGCSRRPQNRQIA